MGLLNPHQSAYCKHHSTETALLYIHDHLINAIGSQKLSCLCLLDLSAAFDTIGSHNLSLSTLHCVHVSSQYPYFIFFSLNHHLYADDTQLFLSFRPPDFDSSVTHLQNARDVRNIFFLNFGSVSVRFLKKTRIRFGINLVRFGLQKLGSVRIVIYY